MDADEYHNRGGIGKANILEKSHWWGNNARYGLFLLADPGIWKNKRLDTVTIFDLAPTILHLMNVSSPGDMDGRVLKEIFKEGTEPAQREVKYEEVANMTETEKESLKRTIRKLASNEQREFSVI